MKFVFVKKLFNLIVLNHITCSYINPVRTAVIATVVPLTLLCQFFSEAKDKALLVVRRLQSIDVQQNARIYKYTESKSNSS